MATTATHCVQLAGATVSTHRITSISCKKKSDKIAFKETKEGFVDYDRGLHEVSTKISGLRKDNIATRYRLRVAGNRFQKDWTVSEVADLVLSLDLSDDIDGLLNRWIGRYARKNFPYLIKVFCNFRFSCAPVWAFFVYNIISIGFFVFEYVGVDAARVHWTL